MKRIFLISIVFTILLTSCSQIQEVKPFNSIPTQEQITCEHTWDSGVCLKCKYECGHNFDFPTIYSMCDATEHFVIGYCSCGIKINYREPHSDNGTGCSLCEYDYSERLGEK